MCLKCLTYVHDHIFLMLENVVGQFLKLVCGTAETSNSFSDFHSANVQLNLADFNVIEIQSSNL